MAGVVQVVDYNDAQNAVDTWLRSIDTDKGTIMTDHGEYTFTEFNGSSVSIKIQHKHNGLAFVTYEI